MHCVSQGSGILSIPGVVDLPKVLQDGGEGFSQLVHRGVLISEGWGGGATELSLFGGNN